jgi:protein TonB
LSTFGFIPKDDPNKPAPVLKAGVDSSLGEGAMLLREEGTLASLWTNLREAFFPVKLPPLVLESKPIPRPDLLATKQDPRATASAIVIYAVVIAICVAWGTHKFHQYQLQKAMELTEVVPPPMDPALNKMGGGGGQHGAAPVSKGRLPKFAEQQITPPAAPPLEEPKIRMPDPTIQVQTNLKMANNNMPNFGDPNSTLGGNSLGRGNGTGIGNGYGNGLGPGSGGNYGGGVKNIGGGVKGPILTYSVEPEFSEEARKAKFQGVVLVGLIVDLKGMPQNVHILRGVGMGLDEKAMEAVRQYRFKPGTENGKAVATYLNVEVNFEIF